MFDLDSIRAHFPGLSTDWALFDNAGGSVPLGSVADRVAGHMRDGSVQLGATYEASARASAAVAAGRAAAARLVHAEPDEIVLGPSSSANVRLLARALRPLLAAGDEIVVTNLDHESNIGAWRELAAEGITIREWRFDPDTRALERAGLESVLSGRTKLVAFTHVSNLVGTVHDAADLVRLVHDAGALACVDAVAYAPHRRVDVSETGADVTMVSMYKVFGPHVGLLHVRRALLERLRSQNHFFLGDAPPPYRLEPGGVAHELVASLPAVIEYLLELDASWFPSSTPSEPERLARTFAALAGHEAALVAPLLDFLASRRDVRVLGEPSADPGRRVPTVSFAVDGRDASAIPPRLDAERVAVRWGHFYAHRAVDALGLAARGGVVRASLAHYNTPAEVRRLIAALEHALD